MKKLAMLAMGLAALMEEANDGTTGSASGGAVTEQPKTPEAPAAESAGDSAAVSDQAGSAGTGQTAPDVADTSGDTAGKPAGAHLDAPAAAAQPEPEKAAEPDVDQEDEIAVACAEGKPRIALVGKYGDRVPVQLKNKAHLEKLKGEHPGAVEVQS